MDLKNNEYVCCLGNDEKETKEGSQCEQAAHFKNLKICKLAPPYSFPFLFPLSPSLLPFSPRDREDYAPACFCAPWRRCLSVNLELLEPLKLLEPIWNYWNDLEQIWNSFRFLPLGPRAIGLFSFI